MGIKCNISFKNEHIKEKFINILNTGYSWSILKDDFENDNLEINIKNQELVKMLYESINKDSIKDIGFNSYAYIDAKENEKDIYILTNYGEFKLIESGNDNSYVHMSGEFQKLKENWDNNYLRIIKEVISYTKEKDICIKFNH